VAHLAAAGDLAEQHVLLEFDIGHQAELAEGHARVTRGQRALLGRILERRQRAFERDQEARHDVGASALDLAQGLEAGGLDIAAAGLVGELEQLLLGFIQGELQAALEFVGRELEHALEQLTHAPR